MFGWFRYSVGYGFGAAVGKAIFGGGDERHAGAREPIRQQTEAEILADEKRYAEDEKRLDAAEKRGGGNGTGS